MSRKKPTLVVITGPNGAGKSSMSSRITSIPVFDGDKVYKELLDKHISELSKWKGAKVIPTKIHHDIADREMRKLFQDKLTEAIQLKKNFAYEGHFSANGSEINTISKFKNAGYNVELHYVGVSEKISLERVADRASRGGLNIPIKQIHANFQNNASFLNKNFKMFDKVMIYDNTINSLKIKLGLGKGMKPIVSKKIPNWLRIKFPNILKFTLSIFKGLSQDRS